MKRLGVFLVLLSIAMISCSDESNEGDIILNLKAVFDGEPLIVNTGSYEYADGKIITFSKLTLYLSDINLIKNNGDREEINDIAFIDWTETNRDLAGAEAGVEIRKTIPTGKYKGIEFGIGVAPDLNAMEPGDFSNDHPLAQAGQYWTVWNSFIFSKTEGKYDADDDGQPELGFAYHLGSDLLYREFDSETATGSMSLDISGDGSDAVNLSIDFRELFDDQAGGAIDISATPSFHNPADPDQQVVGVLMADNYKKAMSIDQ